MGRTMQRLFKDARLARWMMSLYPPFLFTATQVQHIARDWSEVRVRMPLLLTRNILGTQFGGALYAMCDPWFVIMLMQQLGPDFIVWDKAATIQFRRPGRATVYATFTVSAEQLAHIRDTVQRGRKMDAVFLTQVVDEAGEVVAEVEKTLYIRRQPPRGPRLSSHPQGANHEIT